MAEIPATIKHQIRKEALLAEGRMTAFHLALKCNGDLAVLRTELHEVEQRLHTDTNPRMAPGMSPRIYQEGYFAGLRDAIELITRLTAPNIDKEDDTVT